MSSPLGPLFGGAPLLGPSWPAGASVSPASAWGGSRQAVPRGVLVYQALTLFAAASQVRRTAAAAPNLPASTLAALQPPPWPSAALLQLVITVKCWSSATNEAARIWTVVIAAAGIAIAAWALACPAAMWRHR